MESTIQNPLFFFEKALKSEYLQKEWSNFIIEFVKYNGSVYKIEGNSLIIDTEYEDDYGKIQKVYFKENFESDHLKEILDKELVKTYNLIDSIVEELLEASNKSIKLRLKVKVFDKIDALIDNRSSLITDFPIFLDCFVRIQNYVNFQCKKYLEIPFEIDKSPILKIPQNDSETLIDNIFEPIIVAINGGHILNTSDEFEHFVFCMKKFIDDEKFEPSNDKFQFKIKPESILKYIIGRYIVKFRHLYSINQVVAFVNKIITNFENKPQSLSKHYNDRPRNLDSYPFITNNFRKIE